MPANIGGRTLSNGQLLIGGGLVVALINWFIPWWWATSSNYTGPSIDGLGANLNTSAGISGFGEWYGVIGFIVLLVLIFDCGHGCVFVGDSGLRRAIRTPGAGHAA